MTSAFSQKYYVASFVQRLYSALDQDGTELALKVPERDYDAGAQSHHLGRLLDRRKDYIGGIIFASEVPRLRDDLLVFRALLAPTAPSSWVSTGSRRPGR